MDYINIPISPGELLDKITILEIKTEQIQDRKKLQNVEKELKLLHQVWQQHAFEGDEIQLLKRQLKENNQRLWDIEDKIRNKESDKDFDQEFIELARSIYIQNDKRAAIKKEINEKLDSAIIEEKHYSDYQDLS